MPRFFKNTLIGFVIGFVWLGSVLIIFFITKSITIQDYNNIDYIWIWILATILTTILFTVMHGGAFEVGIIPVLNVVSMSIMVTLLLEYTGTIIAPIIAHFFWNTIGGIILGGVSLASDYPNLLESTFHRNSLLSGGNYKIEGSIIVLVVNLILIIYLYIANKRVKLSSKI